MRRAWIAGGALLIAATSWSGAEAGSAVKVPLKCSKGPDGQNYYVAVHLPAQVAEGTTFTVRADGVDSGRISQFGLNYVTAMSYEFAIPEGTKYVEGSARVVPETGSPNVRAGARVVATGGVVTMTLPAQVENGQSYTPPSFELKLTASVPAGTTITMPFRQYRVTANAAIIGNVNAVCDPAPKPYTVATTQVVATGG